MACKKDNPIILHGGYWWLVVLVVVPGGKSGERGHEGGGNLVYTKNCNMV